MEPGNIVLINGTSSAGKTTTARELQQIMEMPYIHTGIDHFLPRVPHRYFTVWDGTGTPPPNDYFLLLYSSPAPRTVTKIEEGETVHGLGDFAGLRIGPEGVKLLAGMYRSFAALAASGINVIVDDVIHDRRILQAAVNALADLPVLFVGLRLPRELAERRERERGDRGPGGAATFYDLVHAHAIYDLELDTSVLSPEKCALQIKEALENGRPRLALRCLRASLSETEMDEPEV